MIKIGKTSITAVLLTALLYGSNLYALSFEDIASDLDDTFEVQSAFLQSESAYSAARLAEFPGDMQMSVTPGVRFTPGSFEYYASSSLKIPLGLSQAEKEKLSFLNDNYEIASARVDDARNKAFLTLYTLYQKAYLLQEEESVIRMELDAAVNQADIFVEQYKSGSITLSALSAAQRDLQDKEEELSQKLLEQRLSLYELAFTTGKAVREDLLERFELKMEELPLPPELTLTAMEHNSDIKAQNTKILQLQQTISRLGKLDISASIKPFFSSGDHSVSAEYSIDDSTISAAYSFPLGSTGTVSSSGSNSVPEWNAGINASLSYSTGKTDKLNTEVLNTQLKQEAAQLEYLTNLVSLQIRSSYQEYLKAKDSLEQSKRDLERSKENMNIVNTKAALGQTAEYEIKEAEAQVKRAEWKMESSRVNLEKAYLNTVNTASWEALHE